MQIAFPQPRDKEANAETRGRNRGTGWGRGIFVRCSKSVLHCEYVIVSTNVTRLNREYRFIT